MKLVQTTLPEVVIVEPTIFPDERGWFMESYNERDFSDLLVSIGLPPAGRFVQENHCLSARGVVRGMHYQLLPHPQAKLVRAVRGSIYDVAIDVRRGSKSFGRWVGVELSETNLRQLWVPEGFAHGFMALEDATHVTFKTTDFYYPPSERRIRWNSPDISIQWPALGVPPVIAARDLVSPCLREAEAALIGGRTEGSTPGAPLAPAFPTAAQEPGNRDDPARTLCA